MPKKTQRMVYAKGKSVFELIDPDGHIYVLQAHDAQFPIESLAELGEQMKQLPKGWQYRTRALTEDLVLDLGPDCYMAGTISYRKQVKNVGNKETCEIGPSQQAAKSRPIQPAKNQGS